MATVSQAARRHRRRTEILELAAIGLRRREIAEALGISERTVQRTTATAKPDDYPVPERLRTATARKVWRLMMADRARRADGALARYVEPRVARVLARLGPEATAPPARAQKPRQRDTGTDTPGNGKPGFDLWGTQPVPNAGGWE
jgi:hypothetical protein